MNNPIKRVANKYRNILQFRDHILLRSDRPLITFTFDDFPISSYETGGAILDKFSCRSTYFASLSLINKENHLGAQFSEKTLIDLVKHGHEIGSHTHDHLRPVKFSASQFDKQLALNNFELNKILPEYSIKTFSYPFGELKPNFKSVVNKYFTVSRGIYPGLNRGLVDRGLIKSYKLYNSRFSKQMILRLLKRAHQTNSWIVFYTHDVRNGCSDFGCSPSQLEYTVKIAMEMGFKGIPMHEISQYVTLANE